MVASFDPLGQIANGLNLHSRHMNIIGENLNHLHTVGAKQLRPEFRSQVQDRGLINVVPNAPGSGFGGITSTVRQDILRQGLIAQSQRPFDLALSGNGFFIVENRITRTQGGVPQAISLTRNGQIDRFVVNENGKEVTYLTLGENQNFLLGWAADKKGQIVTSNSPNSLKRIEINEENQFIPPSPTSLITTRMNLDVSDKSGIPVKFEYNFYDQGGELRSFEITFTRVGVTNEWVARYTPPEGFRGSGEFRVRFDANGQLVEPNPGTVTLNFVDDKGANQPIVFDFRETTSYNTLGTPLLGVSRDGYAAGELVSLRFDEFANLFGTFTNGQEQKIAQLAIGDVRARERLIPESGLKWKLSRDSGELQVLDLTQDGRVKVIPGSVEYANMELADLFSEMIISQRIYGALSKSLQTMNELTETAIATKA